MKYRKWEMSEVRGKRRGKEGRERKKEEDREKKIEKKRKEDALAAILLIVFGINI